MDMNRRDFLRTAAAGAGVVSLPAFLRAAFAEEADGRARIDALVAARTRATAAGKPLLLLVVPGKDDAKYERGSLFGEWIIHGGRDAQEELLCCEIACATMAEAHKALPGVALPAGEPLMVLLETKDGKLAGTAVDPELPAIVLERAADENRTEQALRNRIALVAQAVHKEILPEKTSIEERAGTNHRALPEFERASLTALVEGTGIAEAQVVARGAAFLRFAAAKSASADARKRIRDALAEAYKTCVLDARPSGAKWAESCGCGVTVEGDAGPGVACGMGYVPELSRRFLWFFTK
jgi:hypothetical protein